MKHFRYLFLFFVAFCSVLVGCREDDDIPPVDNTMVGVDYLRGGWKVTGSHVYWDLTAFGTTINKTYNFKKLIANKIAEETEDVSIYFANESLAFYVRHRITDNPPYLRSSRYRLNTDSAGYMIAFEEPELLTFYAPFLYFKTGADKNKLTLYLRRAEVIDMLVKDGTIDDSYIGLIRSNVNNAEVDLYMERDTLPIYRDINTANGIPYF